MRAAGWTAGSGAIGPLRPRGRSEAAPPTAVGSDRRRFIPGPVPAPLLWQQGAGGRREGRLHPHEDVEDFLVKALIGQ